MNQSIASQNQWPAPNGAQPSKRPATVPYVEWRATADDTWRAVFRRASGKTKTLLVIPLPDDIKEPWYSPAYLAALTRSQLRPGKIREVLESLPYSLARCIQLYKSSGELTRRSTATQMQFDRAAAMLSTHYGWIDVRQMSPGSAAFLTSTNAARDHRCKPQEVGAVLTVVLDYAARQGTHTDLQAALEGLQFRTRRVLPKQPRVTDLIENPAHEVAA